MAGGHTGTGTLGPVRFTPLTPSRLARELARWIDSLTLDHPVVGFDGAGEIGAGDLADAVAGELLTLGRVSIRASTPWWWRPASLRLEYGRTDIDMLLAGWVDVKSLRRELLDPLGPGGSGQYLRRLRDPVTDRSVREPRRAVADRAVLLLDGPFLQATGIPLDGLVYLQVTPGTLARALPPDRQWWVDALRSYLEQDRPGDAATAVVAYDHPAAPAIAWADGVRPAG